MEWSSHEIARVAGTTSRTLRHYGDIGILAPTRIGRNGYRYYDQAALIRLQRIMLLRELGLGLSAIADVLDGERDTAAALRTHLAWLVSEQQRLARQVESVTTTLGKTERGEQLMATEIFDGFDHTQYKDEVIQRWGKQAYDKADRWWNSLSEVEKQEHQQRQLDVAADFGRAQSAGEPVDSDDVQAVTQRLYDWLSVTGHPSKPHFLGLGEMYVNDPRFTANYDRHGAGTAVFIRDAMRVYAERNLSE